MSLGVSCSMVPPIFPMTCIERHQEEIRIQEKEGESRKRASEMAQIIQQTKVTLRIK